MERLHEQRYKEYKTYKNALKVLPDPAQPSARDFFGSSSSIPVLYPASHYKQKQLTASLVENIIVKCCLPVSLVDNEHFKAFLMAIDPSFKCPCRQTVTSVIIPQMLESKQRDISELLKTVRNACLTVDIWTDRRMHSFIGITVHAYNEDTGSLITKLLTFRAFKGSHTGQRISEAIEAAIVENNLQNKVQFVVTDNASNMRKALTFMFPSLKEAVEGVLYETGEEDGLEDDEAAVGDFSLWEDIVSQDVDNALLGLGERIPCFAHSVQLVVRDGLQKIGSVRQAIAKCSKLASIVHQSSLFCSTFQEVFGQRSIPSTNDTRWNSTYIHLRAIVNLDQAKLIEVLKKTSQMNLALSNKDILQLQELLEILEPFAECTDLTQGDQHVTISCVVPVLVSLNKILAEKTLNVKFHSVIVRELHHNLWQRFCGIYNRLSIAPPAGLVPDRKKDLGFNSSVFVLAAALDPQHGFLWLADHPGTNDQKLELKNQISSKILILCLRLDLIFSLSKVLNTTILV